MIRRCFLRLASAAALTFTTMTAAQDAAKPSIEFAIALHGGAGSKPLNFTPEERRQLEAGLAKALETGRKILAEGGTALDAVEATVRVLEDDPQFNAGKGAIFNAAGAHEMDASIMDGSNKKCGAVTCLKTVKNPISLARLVMTETPHILLAGDGAEKFADAMKDKPQIERVPNSYFTTEKRRQQWLQDVEEARRKNEATTPGTGTVGCVALDKQGNLAAATSTGGYSNKMYGRVGDTPIIGAGNYADNATCAISGTGLGENFMRNVGAFHVAALMAYKGLTLDQAVHQVLDDIFPANAGGFIAVDRQGNITMHFTTPGMSRAATDSTGKVAIKLEK
ncbi:MAG: isoaspartyl peptidase/L-asparaginase [Pirellulales bacterium]|nr:isoaspartyl peptidase/L-asparaginase [Pirellulales bacterium]